VKFLFILLFSIISGFLYRCGGAGKEGNPRWIPSILRNTKARDFGCPAVFLLAFWLFTGKINFWAYLCTFGAMFGALTTYWDELPINQGQDNFFHHGLGIGLATLMLFFAGINPYNIIIYSLSLSLAMGLWSVAIKDDILEEFGRGFFIISFLPLII